jgi:3-dehydroquinate dehydratase II
MCAYHDMKQLLILNGPNLNLLGTREPEMYGVATLQTIEEATRKQAAIVGYDVDFRQSNHEGVLIDWIQAAHARASGIIINPGALTHTSIALFDALKAITLPVIEVHLSNVHAREEFRRHSYISPAARGIIVGFGADGYELAVDGLARMLAQRSSQSTL